MEKLAIIVTKATLDRFNNMVLLATGAATLDIPVDIFLMHDTVLTVKKENLEKPLKVESEYPEVEGIYQKGLEEGKVKKWYELLEDIKEIGEIRVVACGLAAELFGLTDDNKADIVDTIAGVADFLGNRTADDLIITL